jgi:CRISPR-associated protein Csb3
MSKPEPTIRVSVDPTNPGQFFACCGLLELAHRFWQGAESWFQGDEFCLRPISVRNDATANELLNAFIACELKNAMTDLAVARFAELSSMTTKERAKTPGLDDEKDALEKQRREAPIEFRRDSFNLQIDWFLDDRAGGSRFKTWAGRQSVLEIATAMKKALESPVWRSLSPSDWFSQSHSGCGLPFNFDSNLGGQGSAVDLGFSFDPLASSAASRIESTARPAIELLAFVGLQRFRPLQLQKENRYLYCLWSQPLPPEIASAAGCGLLPTQGSRTFEFRLLYRTKYLKSFLPAIPFNGGSNE